MARMKVLDLFSGIGGMSLGLQRAGMETLAFCELGEWHRDHLRRHWPGAFIHDDVRTLCRRVWMNNPGVELEEQGWLECSLHPGEDFADCSCVGTDQFLDEVGSIDVLAAGFECQDISIANWTGAKGIDGERSGLWSEVYRIICQLGPGYVVLENSPEILARGLDRVLGDLAGIGYDAEWCCVRASAFGSVHHRERWYCLAYPACKRPQALLHDSLRQHVKEKSRCWELAGVAVPAGGVWAAEPPPEPVDDGLPAGLVGRWLNAIGNAVVPEIIEAIGSGIVKHGGRSG